MRSIALYAFLCYTVVFLTGIREANGFVTAVVIGPQQFAKWPSSRQQANKRWIISRVETHLSLGIPPQDSELALWVAAFASSHIGMSAVRSHIMQELGDLASPVVNRGWQLPAWWPGDAVGRSQIFPTAEIAGRQLYRLAYTIISFWTLGSSFLCYLQAASCAEGQDQMLVSLHPSFWYNFCLAVAALSFGTSIASLFNASPLGLMPEFEASGRALTLQRNDALKFNVRGLTRITRHPLILPVVPWGLATSYLAGGRLCDYIFFSGLSAYAIAGCAAQDLRVSRNEGSVGTVFQPSDGEGEQLAVFFNDTSFVPFGAIVDGRQPLANVFREVPWLAFCFGTGLGYYIEEAVLNFLAPR